MGLAALLLIPLSLASTPIERNRQLDELSALWSFYRFQFIQEGRVVELDEGRITTSEGQGYAMLRAVWSNDSATFDAVWGWTRQNLRVRGDSLFAWKWKDRVVDKNSATDADTDIALALILASRRFENPGYLEEARRILGDIWTREILHAGSIDLVTAGNWAVHEPFPTLHVAYLAPYAYQVFAGVDARYPWQALVKSSYDVLHWLYFDQEVRAPPEIIYADRRTGALMLKRPGAKAADYGYDAVPLFWRVALDEVWFGRREGKLRQKMLAFFEEEWRDRGRIVERYTTAGEPISTVEGLPQMTAVHALARIESPALAEALRTQKLDAFWEKALAGSETPYYLHNWLWFDRALELRVVRHFDEFLGFLRPFDFATFSARFPWALFAATLLLGLLARRGRVFKMGFLAGAFAIAVRYLFWRATNTLNFYEAAGPFISIALLLAEAYSFSTVALLVLQVGIRARRARQRPPMPQPEPSVDIFIPIYSESLDILDKTLTAAAAIRYANKRIHVCDDSHRAEVASLAAEHGASYIPGPKKHAKAGNLNNAMSKTSGELLLVFDTDHLPVRSFLEETVPFFADPQVGILQTPHHFYNHDIFQRALRAGREIPNEQDMFNHAIQAGRDGWGGSFFVGSGALFRRAAMEKVGGFQLLSITEDIHTSQHIHARGYRSVFVDKDLAVGLTAENLSGYLVQRRRWMLGCLQIFFKDNPLFLRGLPLRHRLGYFASLYYFFFPLARVVFWITPLYFLFFHLHPLFTEVSVLLAFLLPYLIVLPLVTRVLLPGWPRLLWGTLYETVVSFTLARAMLDLVLPSRLGFKVTPKGVVSEQRRFDFVSSRLTLIATALTLIGVAKGLFEFRYFGIEKDAYFINLVWAIANLSGLLVALLVAWESPQRRAEERFARNDLLGVREGERYFEAPALDMSLSGVSFAREDGREWPREAQLDFVGAGLTVQARLVYEDRGRCAYQLGPLSLEERRALVRLFFSAPEAWARDHRTHTRSAAMMAFWFVAGVMRALLPLRPRRRLRERQRGLQRIRLVAQGRGRTVMLRDHGKSGLGLLVRGAPLDPAVLLPVLMPGQPVRFAQVVHQRRRLSGLWRVGLRFVRVLPKEERADAYLVA